MAATASGTLAARITRCPARSRLTAINFWVIGSSSTMSIAPPMIQMAPQQYQTVNEVHDIVPAPPPIWWELDLFVVNRLLDVAVQRQYVLRERGHRKKRGHFLTSISPT